MMFSRGLIMLPFVLAFALQAAGAEIDARGAAQGDGRYDTDKSTVVIDSRVDFEVDVGPFSFGGAYRAYDFGEGGYNPRGIDRVYDFKHRYVEGRTGNLYFRGGDYFSTFGRGLTLRSYEDIGLEHDTSLDGFIAEYQAGPIALVGLAGTSTEKVTEFQQRTYRLRAGRAQMGIGSHLSVAVSGVDRDTEREDTQVSLPEDLARFADHVVGGEVEAWLGPITLAGEYAGRSGDYYPELKHGNSGGHGAYVSGTALTSWCTLLAEYKDYEKFDHALVNPPTCVRDHLWVLMNRVTHQVDLGNERGFLLEGTLMPSADVQITGGASEARRQAGGLVHWEIFGQMDQNLPRWGISSVAGSWSREYVMGKFTEYKTGVLDLAYETDAFQRVELELEVQRTDEPSGEAFETYLVSLAFYPGSGLTISGVAENTSQDGLDRDLWLFGDVRVAVSDDFEVSLGGGTERGGKKCSGGICFTEPEFAGIRLRFLTYF
jgi:hypothetical protein